MNDISGMTKDEKDMKKYTATDYTIDTTSNHPLLDENIAKIQQLEKENAELKKTIKGFRKGYADLNNYSDTLKSKLANQKYLTDKDVIKVSDLIWNLCKKNHISSDIRNQIIMPIENLCKLAVATWLQLEEQKQFTDTNARIALRFKEELANQKYLDISKIRETVFMRLKYDDELKSYWGYHEDICDLITAICNLAVKIDKDKMVEVVGRYLMAYTPLKVEQIVYGEQYLADEIISAIGGK